MAGPPFGWYGPSVCPNRPPRTVEPNTLEVAIRQIDFEQTTETKTHACPQVRIARR